MSRTRAYALVAAVCALPRLVVVAIERGEILLAYTEKSDDFARTLVASGTVGFIPGVPSAYTQPLYTFFLAPLYWVFGRHWLVVGLAQTLVAVATALLVYEIGRRIASQRVGDRRRGALHAAPVPRLARRPRQPRDPGHAARRGDRARDAGGRRQACVVSTQASPSDGAAPIGGELVSEAHKVFRRRAWLWGAILGALLGLAILGNSRLVLLPLVIVGYLAWRLGSARTILTLGAAGAAGIVLVLAPWVVRNEVSVGCYAITTDTRALWKANNPATYDLLAARQVDRRRPEHPRRAALARVPGARSTPTGAS